MINAVSFAGLGFLSFYLAGKMHLFDTRGHTASVTITPANTPPLNNLSAQGLDIRDPVGWCLPCGHFTHNGLQT